MRHSVHLFNSLFSCDDGNTESGDGCSAECQQEEGWACNGTCTTICGDSLIFGNETCDDGNTESGDGCSDECQQEEGWTCTGETESLCVEDSTGPISSAEINQLLTKAQAEIEAFLDELGVFGTIDVVGTKFSVHLVFGDDDTEEEIQERIQEIGDKLEEEAREICKDEAAEDDSAKEEEDCDTLHVTYEIVQSVKRDNDIAVIYTVQSGASTLGFCLIVLLVTMLAWF
eukprot:TRINITY_DN3710_c0_g1_i1.p1 TRINITY_DN3710_c0_g1~~TRINITY_DN3710_c0_g1_i1.p1  ORF type:complete len:229 (-),score=80.45 TRINITY_DN3710_c0_g1_i1:67-753(-)